MPDILFYGSQLLKVLKWNCELQMPTMKSFAMRMCIFMLFAAVTRLGHSHWRRAFCVERKASISLFFVTVNQVNEIPVLSKSAC